jgi:hypothetical protein
MFGLLEYPLNLSPIIVRKVDALPIGGQRSILDPTISPTSRGPQPLSHLTQHRIIGIQDVRRNSVKAAVRHNACSSAYLYPRGPNRVVLTKVRYDALADLTVHALAFDQLIVLILADPLLTNVCHAATPYCA